MQRGGRGGVASIRGLHRGQMRRAFDDDCELLAEVSPRAPDIPEGLGGHSRSMPWHCGTLVQDRQWRGEGSGADWELLDEMNE
uniref:Uncharacterized protein n=1 Tax=Chromera velia CCMP2878 TaxID=1169474 RepID=A0A0G4I546_9ALVE|eukprot:Cvel_35920.t1-p1 / transcript=Cvel_35920.t1 / gene=Cvel_35920 / organism=Chromera_velia_CCMP2878 / gene_product=Glutamate--cysteine ligase, putative / transcript_product=Glutamate--cysteine ligase, putative / location=Cvel_scaffold6798:702-1634(-) / protein_length=82 / sequence_SO=supercontig / SO=protein_coding / is_pseudo=false